MLLRLAILTDATADDAGESFGNVPRPRSCSGNDDAYNGLRNRGIPRILPTNVTKPAGVPPSGGLDPPNLAFGSQIQFSHAHSIRGLQHVSGIPTSHGSHISQLFMSNSPRLTSPRLTPVCMLSDRLIICTLGWAADSREEHTYASLVTGLI
ncbi:unnamed protein product [Protopolystoma xenopodis]|uniref:Uncharacterized protein n=1 Tax=Protopolystoma xenopodis TaxID=117903 RepID=A0A3S5CQT5_9PLAT|nr:unnamed protein product [Protopolystoma xenopodis]